MILHTHARYFVKLMVKAGKKYPLLTLIVMIQIRPIVGTFDYSAAMISILIVSNGLVNTETFKGEPVKCC